MKSVLVGVLLCAGLLGQGNRATRAIVVEKRVALVMGNGAYEKGVLKNPGNDAADVEGALRRLGFRVTRKGDLSLEQMERAVDEFVGTVGNGDLAFVFYAGHGLQVGGENYLVPVNFAAASEADVKYKAYAASRLREKLDETGARVKVLVLDACRNNPYKFKRDLPGGLAAMGQPAEGTLIAFAAGDNQTADENVGGRNGLFTKHLLAALEEPGASLKDVFERTRAEVYAASGKKQRPAIYDEVIGRLVLREGKREERTEVAVLPKVDEEEVYFGECKERKGAFCEAYLERFPEGKYARLAKLYLGEGRKEEAARVDPLRVEPGESKGETTKLRPSLVGLMSGFPPVDTKVGTKKQGPDGLMYVWIPKGSFQMGCSPGDGKCRSNEKPAKRVEIKNGFWMGQTEVTQSVYERITLKNPSSFKGGNRPVEHVDWKQARDFCRRDGGRLPTEAEWEYAARAGATRSRYGEIDKIAWYRKVDPDGWPIQGRDRETADVGKKDPNAWGLYDMLGNVWEWTETNYDLTTRVLRGGSSNDVSQESRASYRFFSPPSVAGKYFGFRCVKDSL